MRDISNLFLVLFQPTAAPLLRFPSGLTVHVDQVPCSAVRLIGHIKKYAQPTCTLFCSGLLPHSASLTR